MKRPAVPNIAFLINTYNRNDSLDLLIQSIHKIDRGLHIYIIDDGSDIPVTKYKFHPNITIHHQYNKGKPLYWQTCNTLFDLVRQKNYEWFVMLPDDVTIKPDFIDKIINKWYEIGDNSMIALNLIMDREGLACWTKDLPVDMGHSWKTGWVDMCFMCRKIFFSYVGQIPEIKRDWDIRPMLGSGVGSYVSRIIASKKGHFYQVKESLVTFQDSHKSSVMNPPFGIPTEQRERIEQGLAEMLKEIRGIGERDYDPKTATRKIMQLLSQNNLLRYEKIIIE